MKGFDDEPPTDLEQVRKMAKNAKNVLKEMEKWTRKKNYFLELQRELNNRQEKKFVDFAEKRWSIERYLGYKKLQKEALEDVSEGE